MEISPHVLKRMIDRSFTEVELRSMLEDAKGYRQGEIPTRWVIETRHRRRRWEVIVEPDPLLRVLVVVTAYEVS